MAYKRQIDQLPIIPKDAKELNVVCHYCIVGCGHKAYTWPTNKQGGHCARMYNIVKQNGEDVHIVIKPDQRLRGEFGVGLRAGSAHGRDELFASAQHAINA